MPLEHEALPPAERPESFSAVLGWLNHWRTRVFGTSDGTEKAVPSVIGSLADMQQMGTFACDGYGNGTVTIESRNVSKFEFALLLAELASHPQHIKNALAPRLKIFIREHESGNLGGQLLPNGDIALYVPSIDMPPRRGTLADSCSHECGELMSRLLEQKIPDYHATIERLTREDFEAAFREIERIFHLKKESVSETSLVHGIPGMTDDQRKVVTYWFRSNEVAAEAFRAYLSGENYVYGDANDHSYDGLAFARERVMRKLTKAFDYVKAKIERVEEIIA